MGNDKKRSGNERPKRKAKKRKTRVIDSSSSSEDELYDPKKDNMHDPEEEHQIVRIDINDILSHLFGSGEGEDEEETEMPHMYEKYLSKLNKEKRKKLENLEKKLLKFNPDDIPLRYKILESDMQEKTKKLLLQKIIHFEKLNPMQPEYFKLKKYMDGILNLPLGKFKKLPVKKNDNIVKLKSFMTDLKNKLDKCIYGQETAKDNILQIIAKWISNPQSTGSIIGLCGPPGVGKTSLVKNGLSKALDLPFSFVTLGGSSNASSLEGFEYTYEGSKWGRIAEILMENNCMNPVIFFDELDKISDTKAGEEIASILIHLTDPSQNNSFMDKFYSGIELDLSKAFMIFSFNDINKINPILRDRIKVIHLDGFNITEKIVIAKDFSIDKICKNIGFDKNKLVISEDTIRFIISTYCKEKGVRDLEKCLESLIMKLNLYDMTKDLNNLNIKDIAYFEEPYHIDNLLAMKILDPIYRKDDMSISVKMMYS
jgi:ATP-dependent Lon protease